MPLSALLQNTFEVSHMTARNIADKMEITLLHCFPVWLPPLPRTPKPGSSRRSASAQHCITEPRSQHTLFKFCLVVWRSMRFSFHGPEVPAKTQNVSFTGKNGDFRHVNRWGWVSGTWEWFLTYWVSDFTARPCFIVCRGSFCYWICIRRNRARDRFAFG